VADWGGGMSASCKPRIQLFADTGSAWLHSALWYLMLMPISCHFRDYKVLLSTSPSHVRSAIASSRLSLFSGLFCYTQAVVIFISNGVMQMTPLSTTLTSLLLITSVVSISMLACRSC